MEQPISCELCVPKDVVVENELAFVRYDDSSLSKGHVLAIPRRHVANFFDAFRSGEGDHG